MAVQDDGTVFCTLCCKTLQNLTSGKRHFNEVHQSPGMATCEICNSVVKKRSIYMHYKNSHGISGKSMKNIVRL